MRSRAWFWPTTTRWTSACRRVRISWRSVRSMEDLLFPLMEVTGGGQDARRATGGPVRLRQHGREGEAHTSPGTTPSSHAVRSGPFRPGGARSACRTRWTVVST